LRTAGDDGCGVANSGIRTESASSSKKGNTLIHRSSTFTGHHQTIYPGSNNDLLGPLEPGLKPQTGKDEIPEIRKSAYMHRIPYMLDVAYNLIYGSNSYRNFCGKKLFRGLETASQILSRPSVTVPGTHFPHVPKSPNNAAAFHGTRRILERPT
jgi:hypothetical protein